MRLKTMLSLWLVCVMAVAWQICCVSELDQRQNWQDCGNVYHEECVDTEDFRACEYEYYKECIKECINE